MRIYGFVLVIAVLMGLAEPRRLAAQEPIHNMLDGISWQIGGVWTAEGDKGPDGQPYHVETKMSWTSNHRAVKFTTWFFIDGQRVPMYEGLYAWHPAKKKFVFLYTDNKGNLTEGEATPTGGRLEHEFQIVRTDGTAKPYRSTVVRTGPDDYDWNVQQQNNHGEWVITFGMKYTRKPD